MSEWIDNNLKLPDEDGRYLACYGSVFIARYIKSANKWERDDSYTGLTQLVSH